MKLLIKIESGNRKGYTLDIDLGSPSTQGNIKSKYILETEAVSFHLASTEYYEHIDLILENIHYEFIFRDESLDGIFNYYLKPRRLKNGAEALLFMNYFGIASLIIMLRNEGDRTLCEVPPIEILAKKISAIQANKMVDYILSQPANSLLDTCGATRLGASSSVGGNEPSNLLEQLLADIRTLEELTPYIVNKPLSSLSSHPTLKSGRSVDVIHEEGISWLFENLSVLNETDSLEEAHLSIDDTYYSASELLTSELKENTDIYENRVIHTYIKSLLSFTHELLSGLEKYKHHSRNSHDGYISFYETMNKLVSKASKKDLDIIERCRISLVKLQDVYSQYVPVNGFFNEMPRISEKVKANRHYLSLYMTMISWYQNNEIDWSTKKLLLAITDIPKLFELYNLTRIKDWCARNSQNEIPNYNTASWKGEIDGADIELHYEPIYWMEGHSKSSNIVNTENRTPDASLKDARGLPRGYNDRSHRAPDFVISKTTPDNRTSLIILDAKYTTPPLAYTKYLPQCTMKYVHGISGKDDGAIATSMIILHPDNQDVFRDFHVSEYGVFSRTPQLPVLGCQSITFETHELGLDKLLSSLIKI